MLSGYWKYGAKRTPAKRSIGRSKSVPAVWDRRRLEAAMRYGTASKTTKAAWNTRGENADKRRRNHEHGHERKV